MDPLLYDDLRLLLLKTETTINYLINDHQKHYIVFVKIDKLNICGFWRQNEKTEHFALSYRKLLNTFG